MGVGAGREHAVSAAQPLSGQRILVTGGAGTIGSHVVDRLVAAGAADIIVLDNFVRGRLENLSWALRQGQDRIMVVDGDITDRDTVRRLVAGTDVVFNLATGVETSLRELAEVLLAAMDSAPGVEYGPERPVNGVTRRLGDIAAAADRLGWKPEIFLAEGLRDLVSWWRAESAYMPLVVFCAGTSWDG